MASGKEETTHNFSTGDAVEVCEGELIHLRGKIVAIDENKITVLPKHEDLKDPLEFQAHELKKYFSMGDHVRVIAGRFENDTGLIVRVEENMVVLFSDLTMHELKVLLSFTSFSFLRNFHQHFLNSGIASRSSVVYGHGYWRRFPGAVPVGRFSSIRRSDRGCHCTTGARKLPSFEYAWKGRISSTASTSATQGEPPSC